MSVKRFKFVSPGIFLNEIDNSRLPREPSAVGPTIVGRLSKGPGLIPLTVQSMTQFVEVFGEPMPGGEGGDVWREGNKTAPTYAAYAAQAYLQNAGPVNVVRLLGVEDSNAGASGVAGWKVGKADKDTTTLFPDNNPNPATDASVYGLYLFSKNGKDKRSAINSVSDGHTVARGTLTGSLAAVWYFEKGAIQLSGAIASLGSQDASIPNNNNPITGSYTVVKSLDVGKMEFAAELFDGKVNFNKKGKATIVFTDKPNEDTTIALKDAKSGEAQTVVFVIDDDDNSAVAGTHVTAIAENGGGATGTAAALAAAINASVLEITATATGAMLELLQDNTGPGGDTTIAYSDASNWGTVTAGTLATGFTGGDTATGGERVVFNFDEDSDRYIRKVFNTNPTLANSSITQPGGMKNYWLGEAFDRYVRDTHGMADDDVLHRGHLGGDTSLCAMVVPMHVQANPGARLVGNQDSRSGWFISQDLMNNRVVGQFDATKMQKLFRIYGISDGGWAASNLKISIMDMKAGNDTNPYGTFSVVVRRVNDQDGRPIVLERFSQCTLNPNSKDYIAQKIGNQYREWDEADKRYRIYGDYPNQSAFIRVEMDDEVDAGVADPEYLPFGFWGPPRYRTHVVSTSNVVGRAHGLIQHRTLATTPGASDPLVDQIFATSTGSAGINSPNKSHTAALQDDWAIFGLGAQVTASFIYPTLPMRLTASEDGISDAKRACFGVSTGKAPDNPRFDRSYIDVVRRLPSDFHLAGADDAVADKTETSFVFTLDDLIVVSNSASLSSAGVHQAAIAPAVVANAVYASGSRRSGGSYTQKRKGYKDLVRSGFCNFTAPLWGGFDGLDVHEREPFGNHVLAGHDELSHYAHASIKRAVDSVADPEVIEMNALAMPGITDSKATDRIIQICEDRADALAIVDLENGGYKPDTETTENFKTRITNAKVDACVTSLEARGINSSYACSFFPWVKILDQAKDRQLWVPPSVVALGTFGSTAANSEVWFAPAGFTRGGLSDGAGGVPVLGVSQRLSTKERDTLYESNINPIAKFPAEGIVVFGQKTLQVTQSALDRINVRRLMIFVKKEISRMAATLLFDQNVQATWDRFRGRVEPFLDSVKSRFGLSEFRVILDDTTTTPDLIDRNIMYAKIFLKPARAIEYIAIDFVISNTGASFED